MNAVPEPIKKKPAVMFTCYDEKNAPHAEMFKKSLRKFHSEEELPLYEVQGEELQALLKQDPHFFYRQKPVIAERLIKEYECVIGMDCDQLVLGDLSYIWKTTDYDVATVMNFNRADAEVYPLVGGWGILPIEYFNCGLVVMRSEKFVKDWKGLCFSPQFERMQYREQDLLNAICYFGNYNVRCLDHGDGLADMNAWWGMVSKGEWTRAILKNKKIIVPKGEGDTPFPVRDMELKVLHWGGGTGSVEKMNYRTRFNDEIVEFIDGLVK